MTLENTRLLIVVDNADYRQHLAKAGLTQKLFSQPSEQLSEAHWHIFNAAMCWRSQLQEVAIFSAYSAEAYSLATDIGLQLIGSGIPAPDHMPMSPRKQIRLVADFCPTHIVMCTPAIAILSWANRNGIPGIVLLSDWQEPLNWIQRWQHARLLKQLNSESIHWVGSHGIYGCKILATSGINPHKLIPWEWPQPELPQQYHPKQLRYNPGTIELLYTGTLRLRAGVGDLLLALSHLQQKGTDVHLNFIYETTTASGQRSQPKVQLSQPIRDEILGEAVLRKLLAGDSIETGIMPDDIIGETFAEDESISVAPEKRGFELAGDLEILRSQVQQLNLSESVSFTPAPSEKELLEYMRDADLIVIPGDDRERLSTITPTSVDQTGNGQTGNARTNHLHLAMAARTPIVASDHPHLGLHLVHGINAMIFPAGNAKSMAHRIERLLSQPQLYAQISDALGVALSTLKVPARWPELVDYWLSSAAHLPDGPKNQQRLFNWAFSSGRYRSLPDLPKK